MVYLAVKLELLRTVSKRQVLSLLHIMFFFDKDKAGVLCIYRVGGSACYIIYGLSVLMIYFFSRLAMASETSCNVIAELIDMHFRVIIFYFILKPGLQSDFVLFLTTFSHESFHQTRLVFL